MKDTHTPTPWKLDEFEESWEGADGTIITNDKGGFIKHVDEKYAFHCVNSFEAMQEALEIMRGQYKLFMDPNTDALAMFTLNKVDAALKLAKGE